MLVTRPMIVCLFIMSQTLTLSARCDTILLSDTRGKQSVVARNVLVRYINHEDVKLFDPSTRDTINAIDYYFWNARSKMLDDQYARCSRGESYRIDFSSKKERDSIISSMQRKGIHAMLTHPNGQEADLFCIKVSYVSPEGYIMVGSGRNDDTILLLTTAGRTTEIDFSQLASVEFEGDDVTVTKRNKQQLRGKWRGPLFQGLEQRIVLRGIDRDGMFQDYHLKEILAIRFP